jgi:hypothetical protein
MQIPNSFVELFKLYITSGLFGPLVTSFHSFETLKAVIERRLRTRGGLDTIRWKKSIRQLIVLHLAGQTTNLPFEKTGKYGLPSALGPLVEFINSGDSRAIRSVKTFLEKSK